MLKRLALGCVVLLLFVLGLYVTWVMSPPNRNRQLMAEAAARGQARSDEVQRLAADPATNGLLEPTLAGYWTGGNLSTVGNTTAGNVIERWEEYCYPDFDHLAMLTKKDRAYRRARQEMSRQLPSLSVAASRQVFSPGSNGFPRPFIKVHYLGNALAGYAESLSAERRPQEALKALLTGLRLAEAMVDHTNSAADLMGTSFGNRMLEALLPLLQRHPLPTATWREIAVTSAACLPPSNHGVLCLEGEIAWQYACRAAPSPTLLSSAAERFAFSLPGVNRREGRIYDNRVGDLLQQVQALEVPPNPPQRTGTLRAWLVGSEFFPDHSFDDIVAELAATVQQLELVRRKLAAVYTLAALQVYQAEHGRFPARLEALQPLPRFGWKNFEYSPRGRGYRLLLKLDPALRAHAYRNQHPKGYRVESTGLLFERQISAGPALP